MTNGHTHEDGHAHDDDHAQADAQAAAVARLSCYRHSRAGGNLSSQTKCNTRVGCWHGKSIYAGHHGRAV